MAEEAPRRRVIKGLDADQRRELRRQALLDSALDLFARQGYASTTIEQLCQHAFVATKSFYEVFESREACYRALLIQITESAFNDAFAARAEAEHTEDAVAGALIASLAHTFGKDIRIARVTFGEGVAISAAVEKVRRANRRTIAAYVESNWDDFDVPRLRPGLATGLVGGLLDLIADWSHGQPLDRPATETPAQVAELTALLTGFYRTLRAGMSAPPS